MCPSYSSMPHDMMKIYIFIYYLFKHLSKVVQFILTRVHNAVHSKRTEERSTKGF